MKGSLKFSGIVMLALLASIHVQAGETSREAVSYEQYRTALESFGLNPARASEIAHDIEAEMASQSMGEAVGKDDPVAGLPDDFLQINPYEF